MGVLRTSCDESRPCGAKCCCRAFGFAAEILYAECAPAAPCVPPDCRFIASLRITWVRVPLCAQRVMDEHGGFGALEFYLGSCEDTEGDPADKSVTDELVREVTILRNEMAGADCPTCTFVIDFPICIRVKAADTTLVVQCMISEFGEDEAAICGSGSSSESGGSESSSGEPSDGSESSESGASDGSDGSASSDSGGSEGSSSGSSESSGEPSETSGNPPDPSATP